MTTTTTGPRLERAVYLFRAPADSDPTPVLGTTRYGTVTRHIHQATAALYVTVHETQGVHARLRGDAVDPNTGHPDPRLELEVAWTPGGTSGHADLATAPDWVQAAVRQVTR